MAKHDRVEVEWTDTAGKHRWQKPDEIATPCEITTLGYLVHEEKGHIVVTEALDLHDKAEETNYGCTTAIPRSAIRKVTKLGPKRGK